MLNVVCLFWKEIRVHTLKLGIHKPCGLIFELFLPQFPPLLSGPFYYINLLGLAYRVMWTVYGQYPLPHCCPYIWYVNSPCKNYFPKFVFYFLCTNKMLLTSNYAD